MKRPVNKKPQPKAKKKAQTKQAPKKEGEAKAAAVPTPQDKAVRRLEAELVAARAEAALYRAQAMSIESPSEDLVRSVKTAPPSTARTRRGGWKQTFLHTLRCTANITVACKTAGITRATAYEHQKSDKAFAGDWEDAISEGVELWEMEARRRAFDGFLKPKYSEGALIGLEREFSDTLAIFLLKAHRPEKYRERISVKNDDQRRPIDPAAAAAKIIAFLGEAESGTPAV